MKPVVCSSDPRIIDMFNHYHEKSKSDPLLYCYNPNSVNVYFPRTLIEFTDSRSGHSGFDYGMQPFGIRRYCANSAAAVAEIFESCESLAEFVNSSDCLGYETYANEYNREAKLRGLRELYSKPSPTSDKPVSEVFYKKYTWDNMQLLLTKFGNTVKHDWKVLTMNEFQMRYGI